MAHLSDEQLVGLARLDGEVEFEEHVAGCPKCARRLDLWKATIEELPSILAEEVTGPEAHHLQAMFRAHGPEKGSVIRWVASLVRSSAGPAPASVRGSATADMHEYEVGPFTMMLESGPLQGGAFAVHGQVFDGGRGVVGGSRIVVASDDGAAFVDSLDEFGEFHVDVMAPGRYWATVWTSEGAFRVDDLEVGISSGG